jgi:prevent-host-death family protein
LYYGQYSGIISQSGRIAVQSVPLFEAKNRLTALVHEAEEGDPIRITRHGRAVAVLMGSADYAKLIAKDRSFSANLARFSTEWPPDEAEDYADPFAGIRSDEAGRRIEL